MPSVPATGITSGSRGSSRWSPTAEQVMLLEGMYRGGLQTPSATQIQQITTRLSVYGKIEGKNVFYWFKNHKARERQKLRKKLMSLHHQLRLPAAHDQPFLPPHHQLVGGVEDALSCWKKVGLPSHQTCNNLMYDCPVLTMMMMDLHGTTPRVPPKTLQLFPVNADLKGEDQSSNNP